jgi:type II secretory pathway pseudopilin PulG
MSRVGLTFVEILVAILLMSILFAVGWAISNSFLGVKKVRNYEIAVALANQALEAARAARFREIGATGDGRKDTLVQDFSSTENIFDGEKGEGFIPLVRIGNVEFTREVRVTDVPSRQKDYPSGLKLIRVVVQWKASEDGSPLVFEAVSAVAE